MDLEEDGARRADGRLLTEEVLEDIVPFVDQRCEPIDRVVFVPVSEIKLVTSLNNYLTVLFYFYRPIQRFSFYFKFWTLRRSVL